MKITRRQLSKLIRETLEEVENTCWDGYGPGAQTGVKTKKGKGGKRVANCEKISEVEEAINESYFPLQGVNIQRLVYSPSPITGFKDTQQVPFNPERFSEKPKGLWYACGIEWADFVNSAGWQSKYSHLYELEINHYEILFIKSSEDFEKFEKMYGVKSAGKWDSLSIDWPKVASHYAGIEICPYRSEKRMTADWYYGWDVASGCIWSSKGFAGIKEIPLDFHGEEWSWDF